MKFKAEDEARATTNKGNKAKVSKKQTIERKTRDWEK
jgi:hypothetical protein